jgi:hypothetical protein
LAAKAAASADTAKAVSVPNFSIRSAIFICFSYPRLDFLVIQKEQVVLNVEAASTESLSNGT